MKRWEVIQVLEWIVNHATYYCMGEEQIKALKEAIEILKGLGYKYGYEE